MSIGGGAASGAAAGTEVLPGWGTLVGGIGGGIAGAFSGDDNPPPEAGYYGGVENTNTNPQYAREKQAVMDQYMQGYGSTVDYNKASDFSYGGQAQKVDKWGNRIYGTGSAYREQQRYKDLGAGMANRSGPQIDYTNANQDRGLGMDTRAQNAGSLGLMRDAARGDAPSAAVQTMNAGRDAAINAGAAAANSARGGAQNYAAAQGNAMQGAGQQMLQTNQQAGIARAGEMTAARGQYSQALYAQRAQDLQAHGLDAQSAQAQAELEMQQRELNDRSRLAYEGMGQNVNMAQLQAGGAEQGQNYQLGNAQNQLNESSKNRTMQGFGIGAQLVGTVANAPSNSDIRSKENIQSLSYGKSKHTDQKTDAPREKVQSTGSGGTVTSEPAYSEPGPRYSTSQGETIAQPKSYSGPDPRMRKEAASEVGHDESEVGPTAFGGNEYRIGSDEHTKTRIEETKPSKESKYQSPKTPGTNAQRAAEGAESVASGVNRAYDTADAPRKYVQSLVSDKKDKIEYGREKGAQEEEPAQMLEHLHPYSYNYKQGVGEDPSKRRYGIMAQDLERTPMGASIVQEGPHGKEIDVPHATGVQFAALANLHKRLTALEYGKGKSRG
jgi:hypothetical protein